MTEAIIHKQINVLILGATSDMAKALAELLARKGYQLFLASRNIKRLEAFAADLTIRREIKPELIEFDATDFASHQDFYKGLSHRPDWVISFFGYLGDQNLAQQDWAESHKIIDSNYSGMVSILNIVAEDMEKRKQGTIVGVSSVAGDRGRQSNYIYGSAKAALTTYLGGLRNRLYKSGVHVMTVKPGFAATKMTYGLDLPKAITANPHQIAKGIVKGIDKKRNTIYILFVWRFIMLIIKNIPEAIFKKLKL
ncbi:SDR family oxidoreductase [Marivirga sp. S37H4]|uniref:SDR family oxidoreductase n=1 Tax=Marivirga aurantiaca TaxID=2802615 RepID=A0A935CA23_9BACT|nr:SDR family oxidoreductase [Marivirga aurantiaca]MBK6266516.1 SDR family oxidoreductase [Marivirga aurantiaca]